MNLAVHVQTKFGYNLYQKVYSQYLDAKKYNKLSDLKQVIYKEREEAEAQVLHFLNDENLTKTHRMDDNDPNGWLYWKEMTDKYTILNHFYNRK